MAGTIAAALDGAGTAGAAPEAMILPLKVFQGGTAYTSDIIAAIAYAEEQGAAIANMSFGSRRANPALKEAMEKSGMLFVCAAGNGGWETGANPVYPAAFGLKNSISVAALGKDGRLARFSNWGAGAVDLAAPGEAICSSWPGGEQRELDGSSMASAYAAGAAALAKSAAPGLGAEGLKEALLEGSAIVTGLMGKVKGGSKLDAALAVGAARSLETRPAAASAAGGAARKAAPPAGRQGQSGGGSRPGARQDVPGGLGGTGALEMAGSLRGGMRPVIDIPDGPMPETAPGLDAGEEEEYELSNAENFMAVKASLPTPRYGLKTVELGGKIYAMGGKTSSGAVSSKAVDSTKSQILGILA